MNRTILWLSCIAPFALAACVTTQPDPRSYEANYPLYCDTKAQCDVMWQRAQIWVTQNAGYRLQTVTDTVIQTFGPFGSKVDLAAQVLKEPMNDGGGKITIRLSCDNLFGCQPDPLDAKLRFKAYVGAK